MAFRVHCCSAALSAAALPPCGSGRLVGHSLLCHVLPQLSRLRLPLSSAVLAVSGDGGADGDGLLVGVERRQQASYDVRVVEPRLDEGAGSGSEEGGCSGGRRDGRRGEATEHLAGEKSVEMRQEVDVAVGLSVHELVYFASADGPSLLLDDALDLLPVAQLALDRRRIPVLLQ